MKNINTPNVCIFEDEGFKNFLPLTYTRPVYELFCGMSTLREKMIRSYPEASLHLLSRDYLVPTLKHRVLASSYNQLSKLAGKDCLFLNGRVIAHLELDTDIPIEGEDEIFIKGEDFVGARVTGETSSSITPEEWNRFSKDILNRHPLTVSEIFKKRVEKTTLIDVETITYPWDLIYYNPWAIELDALWVEPQIQGDIDTSVTIYGSEYSVIIGTGAWVAAGVVLDAAEGPIVIDQRAVITPHTIINGPAFIGADTRVEMAQIQSGTSIGQQCRVGGEISMSIFHSHSCKPYAGYIGHSYIGEWVSFDALTSNSHFQNYEPITVNINGNNINSNKNQVGCFIGDYTRTGIGTLIRPGAVIGVGCNLLSGLAPKTVPSFTLSNNDTFILNQLDKVTSYTKNAMEQRGMKQTPADIQLLKRVYQLTDVERKFANCKRK